MGQMKQESRKYALCMLLCFIGPLLNAHAALTHRYKFNGSVADSRGTLNGTASTAGTYLEAPQFAATIPSGALSCGPTQSLRVGMSDGTKKSGFTLSLSVVSTTRGSYSFWMKPNKLQSTDYIMSPLPATSGPYIRGYSASSIALVAAGKTVTAAMTTGVWHHVAVTWDNPGGTAKLYVDGTFVGTAQYTSGGIAPTTVRVGSFNINNDNSNLSQQYAGYLYDLQFYDFQLTAQDVSNLSRSPGSAWMPIDFAYQEPRGLRSPDYAGGGWTNKFSNDKTNQWITSRGRMELYLISREMIGDMQAASPAQFANIRNFMQSKIIALDEGSMTLNGEKNGRDDTIRTDLFDQVVDYLQYLYTNGVTVQIISMQSVMSKGDQAYGITNRVDDAQHFANYVDSRLSARGVPLPTYGLTDASRAKNLSNWQALLSSWVDGMIEIGKEPIIILQDFPASHVLDGITGPADLLEAMQYTQNNLGLISCWWISGGSTDYTPSQARTEMINAAHTYLAQPNASAYTDEVLFGDFQSVFLNDDGDTVNGAPYAPLEVFNEIYNEFQAAY
jgi:hypothetical protein